jgi:MSHA pilin protein MshC
MRFIAVRIVNIKQQKPGGFTLIELLVLITIMGILLSVGLVKMPTVNLYQAESFSSVLISDLNLTKALSMSENQQYRLVIGATSYQIQDETGTIFTHPETGAAAVAYPAGVSVSPSITLVFDSLGKPYNDTTALTAVQSISVTSTDTTKIIYIHPQTGLIQ